MTAREELQRFLQERGIVFPLSSVYLGDESCFTAVREVCEKLLATNPPMLSPGNLGTLHTLLKVAQNELFFTGYYNGTHYSNRPAFFSTAVAHLFSASLLSQDTFNAICNITTANLHENDIVRVAQGLVEMNRLNLLSKSNIDSLMMKVLKAPLRTKLAQAALLRTFDGETVTVSGSDIPEPSCTDQLYGWFRTLIRLSQDEFDFMMNSRKPVTQVSNCRLTLMQRKLWNIPNWQALLDIDFSKSTIELLPDGVNGQELFNYFILGKCHSIMQEFNSIIRNSPKDNLMENLGRIIEHCREIHDDYMNTLKEFPGKLLHGLVLVKQALPTSDYQPTQDNIQELMTFADEAKGHPSHLWQAVGLQMTLLCTAVGVALFPVSVGLAVGATVAALTGIGIFAYAGKRTGLSKDCLDLAEAVQHDIEIPRVVH